MGTCIFVGHVLLRENVESKIRAFISYLITHEGYNTFYVGNYGDFDYQVRKTLKDLKKHYPHIQYRVVLARPPHEGEKADLSTYNTIYPEGMALVSPRYAIAKCNAWMIRRSDCVVSYITHHGNVENIVIKAKSMGKTVYNLPDIFSYLEK